MRFILWGHVRSLWENAFTSYGHLFVALLGLLYCAEHSVAAEYIPGGHDDVRRRQTLQTYFVVRDTRCYSAFVGLLLRAPWRRKWRRRTRQCTKIEKHLPYQFGRSVLV
jgi:hypothetical protein